MPEVLQVDAVLPADVGDAPMRQPRYTRPVQCVFCVASRAIREALSAICRLVGTRVPNTASLTFANWNRIGEWPDMLKNVDAGRGGERRSRGRDRRRCGVPHQDS